MEFEKENPNVLNEDNIDAILNEAKRKKRSKDEMER